MRKIATAAFKKYDLDVSTFSLLGWYTNLLFHTWERDGNQYVLRVCAPGWRTDTDLRSEAMWLEALHRESEIVAPRCYPSIDGDYLVTVTNDGVPESQRCMLMSWVPGISLGKRLNPENLEKMGNLFAQLHAHGRTFSPPPGFTRRKMDCVLAREEPDTLFSEKCLDGLKNQHREILIEVKARVDRAYCELYSLTEDLQVIHHDLWHDNIKIWRGHLHPLDFEDTVWGYPLQDLAMALQDLMMDVSPELFEPYQDSLRKGYEKLAVWPETYPGQIDTFRAGRLLWVANWVASYQSQYLADHLEKTIPWLENYLESGKLRKSAIS
jgi:Ser/Thr protein kinase RdoA (MazF antagonist)